MSPMVPRAVSWRRDPRSGLLVIAFGVAVVSFIALTAALLLAPSFAELDMRVSEVIRDMSVPGLESIARFFTTLGSFWPVALMTAGVSGYLLARGRKAEALLIILTVGLGALLAEGLKLVVHRVRPTLELARIAIPETYSFPSGHTMAGIDFFGSLAFIVLIGERRLRRSVLVMVACVAIALAIGLSRVYLGVHYLGDVLGGLLLGAGWVTLMIMLGASWGAGVAEKD